MYLVRARYGAGVLFGRAPELARIGRLLADARAGTSAALVVRADPGAGKSALLAAAAELAQTQVLRGSGVESESELPFAALQLLFQPVRDRIDRLPDAQATALRRAIGLASSGPADRLQVGLATLTLLSDLAPVVCLVDDAQWIDRPSAEALLFAGRRLQAEGVVLLIAARDEFAAPGLPELRLPALDREAALAIVTEHRPGLSPHVRDRIIAEAAGNPLALIELPEGLPVGPLPLPRRLQEAYAREIVALPPQTQTLLLVVAAEEHGELGTVMRAAGKLGLTAAAMGPAERSGLLQLSENSVRFRHPLIRAAAYRGLPYGTRLAVHRALAEVLTDDRRAWHLAAAAIDPDERTATELTHAAQRAAERGGHAAAALAYERAAALTPDESARTTRLLAAALAAESAGLPQQAADLAVRVCRATDDPVIQARMATLRADAAFESGSPRHAYEVLLSGARLIAGIDPPTAAVMLLTTIRMAFCAGISADEAVAMTEELALAPDDPLRLLLAVARKVTGAAAELPAYEEAVAARSALPGGLRGQVEAAHLIDTAYGRLEDADIAAGLVAECREQGMVGLLPSALVLLSMIEMSLSRWRSGLAHADEGRKIAEDMGLDYTAAQLRAVLAWSAAILGDEERCVRFAEGALKLAPAAGLGTAVAGAARVLSLLDIGYGRYAAALDRLERLDQSQKLDMWLIPERIEAAVRLGRPERAGELGSLAEETDHLHATALTLRCRALLARTDAETDKLYREALDWHTRLSWPFEHARTELLYGEWLRRVRRKHDARTHLRAALEAFELMGARPWADRTRGELRASGDSTERAAAAALLDQLTPQELQIAKLAAAGLTNREIGAQLFLSPKTIGHHLYRAFPKLGVATRVELARLDL